MFEQLECFAASHLLSGLQGQVLDEKEIFAETLDSGHGALLPALILYLAFLSYPFSVFFEPGELVWSLCPEHSLLVIF